MEVDRNNVAGPPRQTSLNGRRSQLTKEGVKHLGTTQSLSHCLAPSICS